MLRVNDSPVSYSKIDLDIKIDEYESLTFVLSLIAYNDIKTILVIKQYSKLKFSKQEFEKLRLVGGASLGLQTPQLKYPLIRQRTMIIKHNKSKKIAIDYGIDLSLIEINLKKTPRERIKNMNNILNGIKILQNAMINNDK